MPHCITANILNPILNPESSLIMHTICAADAPPQTLVALCASHIGNERRFGYLCCMLESWKNQAHRVPLFLSISTDGPWQQRVQDLDGTDPILRVFWQPKHLTQGQHYSFLAHWLPAEYNDDHTWLLFTDDDDIWHPQRAFYYQQVGQALLFLHFAKLH